MTILAPGLQLLARNQRLVLEFYFLAGYAQTFGGT
jgi:hypothetical protein